MLFSPSQDRLDARTSSKHPSRTDGEQARELASTLYNVQHFTGGNAFLPKSSNWARVALFISTYINNVLNTGDHRLAGNPHPDSPVWRLAMEYAQKQARGFKDAEGGKAVSPRPVAAPQDQPDLDISAELDSLADEVQG